MARSVGALVLAGGNARRMNGQNKALLEFGQRSFLLRLSDAFTDFDELLLACGAHKLPQIGRFTPVFDRLPERGPLEGIAAALTVCKSDALVVAACDMPLFSDALAAYLAAAVGTHAAVACRDRAGRRHPLCGVYTKACLPALNAALDAGRLRMSLLFEEIGGVWLPLEDTPFGDALLTNVNTPDELTHLTAADERSKNHAF